MSVEFPSRALIIEDTDADLRKAHRLLQQAGIEDIIVFARVAKAMLYLEDLAAQDRVLPSVIILDLEFAAESGFEVLRFWKANAKLHACRVIVWTIMGESVREICRLFGVSDVVSKLEGEQALIESIQKVIREMSGVSGACVDVF